MNQDDALDATQEAFFKAARQLRSWRKEGTFKAWIGSIAIREALSIVRRQKSRREVPTDPDQLAALADDQTGAFAMQSGDSRERLDRRWKLQRMHEAMAELAPQQRAIVLAGITADLGPSDVAAKLALPENQVRSQLARAVKRLRQILGSQESEKSNEERSTLK
jgi:RNA polymerase sigma-70 factor, ECF subfamily